MGTLPVGLNLKYALFILLFYPSSVSWGLNGSARCSGGADRANVDSFLLCSCRSWPKCKAFVVVVVAVTRDDLPLTCDDSERRRETTPPCLGIKRARRRGNHRRSTSSAMCNGGN